jgi:flagellar hook-basal body protein
MENALLIGVSRQIALHREMEVVANNIANINTTGYKADAAVFEEFLAPLANHGHFQGGDRRLSYVHDRATWHDFKQGPIRQTGNALDVAIEGDAFLVVQTPRGERYTRNGALQINSTGQLVTAEGYEVQADGGAIVLQNTDSNIAIASACARTATAVRTCCAASCGSSGSIRSHGCRRTDRACSPRRPASRRRRRNRRIACASSRARSSNRTCAAWSRCRA